MGRRRVLLLLLLPFVGVHADEASVAKPEVKPADRWTYRQVRTSSRRADAPRASEPVVYELNVTFVGPKAIEAVSTLPDGKEIDTTWTPEWNVVTDGRTGSFFPDTGLLRFPLSPGLRYSSHFEVVRPRRDSFDAKDSLNVLVVGWEEVSVPAGTFRALKVEATGTYQRLDKSTNNTGGLHYVVWYVPQLKRWAKLVFETTARRGGPGYRQIEELLSYRVQ